MRLACIVLVFATTCLGADKLVIHEWGTFTSLQNERGETLGGINVDDEPVPAFVHSLTSSIVANSPGPEEKAASIFASKGGTIPMYHPQVTMRLETPVVYFYPPKDSSRTTIDLSVTFKGGLLSQFYPNADSDGAAHLIMRQPGQYVPVKPETTHTLTWKGLTVGTDAKGPETKDKVWLSPRAVSAASITAGNGESEKYVFYRGVGNLDSPLKVIHNGPALQLAGDGVRGPAWLADIRADGAVAFGRVTTLNGQGPPTPQIRGFLPLENSAYSLDNLPKLRGDLREALIADGLFADEADAMLNTWEASYFKQPGLRVFYIVPKAWTDAVLPMKVSADAQIVRVMVGRIDLVTLEQRALAATITKPSQVKKLGRFAAAILNEEQRRAPSTRLQMVIAGAGIRSADVVPETPPKPGPVGVAR